MGVIVGIIGVLASVLIGFMGPGGPVLILLQPFEFLTIGGGIGFTLLISNQGYRPRNQGRHQRKRHRRSHV
jgi:flagellar motor component MotA